MRLTHIIPTRGRPQRLIETIGQTERNIGRKDTRILVCVDDDDEDTLDALDRGIVSIAHERIIVSIRPREDSRGEKYDRALTEAPADLYLLGVDTVPILTPGYDQILLDSARLFPDGIGCVYGPMANFSFPTLQAITARMADLIGYLYSHEYPFWFIDHELDDICRITGRFTFVDVAMPRNSASQTIRMRDLAWWCDYFDAMTIERRKVAMRIIDACVDLEWRKALLRTQHPVTEHRSFSINQYVRLNAPKIEQVRGDAAAPDPGYLRLKAAAEARLVRLLPELAAAAA